MCQGWFSPSCSRILSRTSGGTFGLVANWLSGSPGASARIPYTTKLMTSRVGMAISSRRMMYRPTLPAPHPIEDGVGSAVEVVHRTTVSPSLVVAYGVLYQSAMFHISESHGLRFVPCRDLLFPEATWKRFTSGMTTTSLIRMSLA